MPQQNNREIELKFDLRNEQNYYRLIELVAKSTAPVRQINRFYDTTDGILRANQLAFRMRREEDRAYVTLKGPKKASKEGLANREELQADLNLADFDKLVPGDFSANDLPEPVRSRIEPLVGRNMLRFRLGFTNERISVPYLKGDLEITLEIDRSEFPDKSVDYELEVEIVDETEYEAVKREVEQLLRKCGIETSLQPKSKLQRAVERTPQKMANNSE